MFEHSTAIRSQGRHRRQQDLPAQMNLEVDSRTSGSPWKRIENQASTLLSNINGGVPSAMLRWAYFQKPRLSLGS